jgi:hypothetical protein
VIGWKNTYCRDVQRKTDKALENLDRPLLLRLPSPPGNLGLDFNPQMVVGGAKARPVANDLLTELAITAMFIAMEEDLVRIRLMMITARNRLPEH